MKPPDSLQVFKSGIALNIQTHDGIIYTIRILLSWPHWQHTVSTYQVSLVTSNNITLLRLTVISSSDFPIVLALSLTFCFITSRSLWIFKSRSFTRATNSSLETDDFLSKWIFGCLFLGRTGGYKIVQLLMTLLLPVYTHSHASLSSNHIIMDKLSTTEIWV